MGYFTLVLKEFMWA
ncbi:hypothetical protein [Borreliella valaisiana]